MAVNGGRRLKPKLLLGGSWTGFCLAAFLVEYRAACLEIEPSIGDWLSYIG